MAAGITLNKNTMPINASHEFSSEQINQIESAGLTVAELRKFLSDFSVDSPENNAAEMELDAAIGGALKAKAEKKLILESYLDNEVSDAEARPSEVLPSSEATTD